MNLQHKFFQSVALTLGFVALWRIFGFPEASSYMKSDVDYHPSFTTSKDSLRYKRQFLKLTWILKTTGNWYLWSWKEVGKKNCTTAFNIPQGATSDTSHRWVLCRTVDIFYSKERLAWEYQETAEENVFQWRIQGRAPPPPYFWTKLRPEGPITFFGGEDPLPPLRIS